MKKLALAAAAVAVLAGCGAVTTTALSPPDSPNIVPLQMAQAQAEPVEQGVREFNRAVVSKKYQNCTTTMAPRLVAAVDNLKSELPPKPPQANLPSMVGNAFMTLPKDMRSSCGGGECPTGATGAPLAVTPPLTMGKK